MAFMGLEIPQAEPGMRTRRLLAFLIDLAVVLVLVFLVYTFTGEPDYFRVQAAMDAVQAAEGQDMELTSQMPYPAPESKAQQNPAQAAALPAKRFENAFFVCAPGLSVSDLLSDCVC